MTSRWTLIAGLVVLALAGPQAAQASTVDVVGSNATGPTLVYQASDGEQNAVTVTRERLPELTILQDPGATIAAERGFLALLQLGCILVDTTVICPTSIAHVEIDLGDGDDSVSLDGDMSSHLVGGPGDDRMRGSLGLDELNGGPGADDMAGGPGFDSIDYWFESRGAGVEVDLDDVADDGEAGEGDNARSDIEFLRGTDHADVLVATDADNGLQGMLGDDTLIAGGGDDGLGGGWGNDILDGGGGNDSLTGSAGDDEMTGGPGNDTMQGGRGGDTQHARDGTNDLVVCDDGAFDNPFDDPGDLVVADSFRDTVRTGCDVVELG